MMYRAQVKNPGRIQVWPPLKVSLNLEAPLRTHVASKAGLEGADRHDPRLLGAAIKTMLTHSMKSAEALQKAGEVVHA